MSNRRKLCVSIAIGLFIVASLLVMTWFDLLTPAAPSGWKAVHVGMTREAVLSSAGAPQISGYPEKIIETWERKGPICNRKMYVGYDAEDRDAKWNVRWVLEGTWLRGYGWLHPPRKSL